MNEAKKWGKIILPSHQAMKTSKIAVLPAMPTRCHPQEPPQAAGLGLRNLARRWDVTSLHLFVAVVESGSIGRAAEREFIAPSAVSKRISDLEATLATPLLYRRARGVDLTAAGETFLHHARNVLFSLEKMQGELSEYAGGVRGHVRMHANISSIVQFLPEDLGAFVKLHEKIKIDLEEHVSAEVIRAVLEGAADMGICHPAGGGPNSLNGLQTQPYRRDNLMLVVPRGHVLSTQQTINFEASLDWDHVGLHSNSAIYLAMHRAAAQAGKSIKLRMHVTGLDAMCRMIHNGLGIGLIPDRAFALMQGVGDLVAIALTDPWAARQTQIVARDFSALPASTRLLVAHLTQKPLAVTDLFASKKIAA
jgi:DNA-binding transcriptional LysR family regulator